MYSVKKFNTFNVDISAKEVVEVNSLADLTCLQKKNEFVIVGYGSNVLFCRDYYGSVIVNRLKGIELTENEDYYFIKVASGESWINLVEWSLEKGVFGLENLADIPGSVGGAVLQNIGAYGLEIKDYCQHVEYYDIPENKFKIIERNNCKFGYRTSIFNSGIVSNFFITSIKLKMPKNWKANVNYGELKKIKEIEPRELYKKITGIRRSKIPNPQHIPNAGSFFKNPIITVNKLNFLIKKFPDIKYFNCENGVKVSAAWLIDNAGLKGSKINLAEVYEMQPLILINLSENSNGVDILNLANLVKSKIYNKYKISLESEVKIIES